MSDNRPQRLQKFLAGWGIASRRTIEEWMRQGRILLNGRRARLGEALREKDELVVLDIDGTTLYRATLRGVYDEEAKRWLKPGFEYWMLNKPPNVLVSARDPHHKDMVTHLVPSTARLFPVGRLDKDSEGLLLLTSDGELCHRLTHPRFGVRKRYEVSLDWPARPETIAAIERGGIMLEEGPTLPIKVRSLGVRRVELEMREGRKREIRRLFEHFGHRVTRLLRVAFGPLVLGDLPGGKARPLKDEEVDALRRAAHLPHHSVEKRQRDRRTRRPGPSIPGQS